MAYFTTELTFIGDVSSCALAVYDLRENDSSVKTELKATQNSLENKHLKALIDENGDICSVFDKRLGKELLKSPVKLAVLNNIHSFDWPAWEIKYDDLCESAYMYPMNPVVRIKDNGNALCSLEIIRKAGKSEFKQIVSLDCESKYLSVYNETDWREEASLLKAEFSLSAENDNASYDIGIGSTKRPTNSKSLCEVPAQKWADITDESESFGVSVFSDSRAGWDKPDKSTLRLTLVHTPLANYRWECSQHVMDMGLNRYSFAVMGHGADSSEITACADEFCQPMHTFVTEKHQGVLGKEYSFVKLNNDKVRITAIKKAQESQKIIFRVAECSGNDVNGVEAVFAKPIAEAFAVRGDETEIKKLSVSDGKLRFNIGHNEIKSFSLVFDECENKADYGESINLNFNAVGITSDANRSDSTLANGISLPLEMMPENLLFGGVRYSFASNGKNCLVCDGGSMTIPSGFEKVHLLLASLNGNKKVKFECAGKSAEVFVPDCFEELGHWDLMRAKETGYIKPVAQATTLPHTHSQNGNLTAKQFYLFGVEIPLDGATSIKLPDDKDVVVFSATAVRKSPVFVKGDSHFDSLEKRRFDYEFSDYAVKRMNPNALERLLNRFFDPTFTINIKAGEFYNKYALNELYHILRNLSNKLSYKKDTAQMINNRKKSHK